MIKTTYFIVTNSEQFGPFRSKNKALKFAEKFSNSEIQKVDIFMNSNLLAKVLKE